MLFLVWRQRSWELNVKLNNQVSFVTGCYYKRHTFSWHHFLVARFDDVVDGDVQDPLVQGVDLDRAASQGLAQGNLGCVDQVGSLTAESGMGFVLHDEHNVGWDIVGALVSLLGESDLGSRTPASLHCDGQDLVPDTGRMAILIHDSS